MSWDVLIVNSSDKLPIDEHWDNHDIPSFGSRIDVQSRISALFPEVNWDNGYGHLRNDIYVGHISLGQDDPLDGSFILHVYGGEDPIGFITTICKAYNWSAFDTTTFEYIEIGNPSAEGWKEFQDFRQHVISQMNGSSESLVDRQQRPKKWWQFWK